MTHNTKVVCPYEKDDQERLMAVFTEEKNHPVKRVFGRC
jgi:hypothetical protein